MPLIRAANLTVGYNGRPVADPLNFEVERGDFLCIVGENGSGKSTLVKTLLRLHPQIGGEITLETQPDNFGIGYLPQQTEVQKDFPASVREVVLSGCLGRCGMRPFYNKEEKRRADDVIERMGISNLTKCCYRNLSGGQQQKVLLARALCAADSILLLDEPVTGLDPKATQEMYNLIQKLNAEGVTILMISHDIEAAITYATHILHLGSSIFFGSRDDYIRSGQGRAYLGEMEVRHD